MDPSENLPVRRRGCDMCGCPETGDFRAPKSRYNLNDYFWFCITHVREYNENWDFFKGMAPGEVENYINRATVWDRPTWRMTEAGLNEERIKQKIYDHFSRGESAFGNFGLDGDMEGGKAQARIDVSSIPHPTVEALSVLELAPPVQWEEVRAKYKTLVKKYHPDTNKDDKHAEDRLKKINIAYTVLKLSYQHYTDLDKKQ